MKETEKESPGGKFMIIAAALGALLPLSLLLLLYAGGALPGAGFRTAALCLGMLAGALGICAAPLTTPFLLTKVFFVPARVSTGVSKYLLSVWVAGPALLLLAAWAFRSLRGELAPDGSLDEELFLSAVFLAAGIGLRAWLEGREHLRRSALGEVEFAEEELACAPGGSVTAVLRTGKKAASVTAELGRYSAGEEVRKTAAYPAAVSGPFSAGAGWEYRITATLPVSPARPGDSWCLNATASKRGARQYASVDILIKKDSPAD